MVSVNESAESSTQPDGNFSAHPDGGGVVTVIGDGQLARMMQTAAIELGQSIRLLAGAEDASAAQVCADVILGDYTNLDDVRRSAQGSTVVTFDHEHVPNEYLDTLMAEGFTVHPQPKALINAQDKLIQRQNLSARGIPVPEFSAIESLEDAQRFWLSVDGHVCLKARRGGYDGHGVWFPVDRADMERRVANLLAEGIDLLAERKVDLERELSAMVARTPSGEVKAWPVVESVQRDGICYLTIAPAPGLSDEEQKRIQTMAADVATTLGVTGVMALELFESTDGLIQVNELAMRPHNTGHWTQDGCVTSQFEQHLRAVSDMPLGSTQLTAPVTVMVNTLGAENRPELSLSDRMAEVWTKFPEAKIHLYGKTWRPGRKLGHVNVCGDDVETVKADALSAAHFIVYAKW